LALQGRSYPRQVVIAVPDGVILEHELARDRGIGVERGRSGLASRLLAEGGQVAAVAGAVGYESEAAFSRSFKKLVGQAPATWRRGTVSAALSRAPLPARR